MSKEKALAMTPEGWDKQGYGFTIEISQPVHDHLMEVKTKNQIVTELVHSSWWASWLPFGWMHSMAARHFSKKAERLYRAQFNSRSTSILQ